MMYKIKPVGPGVRETWIFLKKKKNIYIYIVIYLFSCAGLHCGM